MILENPQTDFFKKNLIINKIILIFLFLALIVVLYYISANNYLLFHSLAEMFSIIVAFGIFIVVWSTQLFSKNYFLLFIGFAAPFIGFIDFIHMLAYKDMGVFPGVSANLATELWIAARYIQAISFLAAVFFIKKKINARLIIFVYFIITAFLFLSIFYWQIFPDCFVEGLGLTAFKKISEYIISAILLLFVFTLSLKRKQMEKIPFNWLVAAGIATIISEIAFTFYVSVYGFSNMVGHIFKILAFYFLYRAIVLSSLQNPYSVLFSDAQKRIADAEEANKALKKEIINRQNLEKKSIEREKSLEKINKYLIGRELKMLELKKEIIMLKNNKKIKI